MKRFAFDYRSADTAIGWMVFAIAAFTYVSTLEPTASFWDCPEFILSGYKLEVGHPPGAPFYMLAANVVSQLAADKTQVAYMVNLMNALLSAATVMFLFWTITHLVRQLSPCEKHLRSTRSGAFVAQWRKNLSKLSQLAPQGLLAGFVGALIYCFSDTFWFSAVEGEVYAFSSFFTAIVFWLILKWEEHADEPHADRYLVLIAYMTGLSIGVHLLNLLCLPSIVLVWYYRRHPDATLRGSLKALAVSFLLLAGVLYGVIPGIVKMAGWCELLFVNVLHCPYNTGVYIYVVLLFLAIASGLWFTMRRCKRLWNTALLCLLMLVIGYSSYAVILIRSAANPPMDQNSPDDVFTRKLSCPRPIWPAPAHLWAGLFVAAGLRTCHRFQYDAHETPEGCSRLQAKTSIARQRPAARRILCCRDAGPRCVCAKYVLPPYVGLAESRGL